MDDLTPIHSQTQLSPARRRYTRPSTQPGTSTLEFSEYSFFGPDKRISRGHLTHEQNTAIRRYLAETYSLTSIWYAEPFLILVSDELLPENELPFTIGGYLAIWQTLEEELSFIPMIGKNGGAEEHRLEDINEDDFAGAHENKVFSEDVILFLANCVFKDCIGIACLWTGLVIELPESDDIDDFLTRVHNLPMWISGLNVDIFYHNGPLPYSERRGPSIQPKPQQIDGDYTDYIEKDRKFYPGCMISSAKHGEPHSSATSGILVQKGEQKRLTCSFHNWGDHFAQEQTNEEARARLEVIQGGPGTKVGLIRERVGTDIALAELDDPALFENAFMETDYSPKTLLHSDDQNFGDTYLVDGFSTGKTKLVGFGRRFGLERRRRYPHPVGAIKAGEYPFDNVASIRLRQGVYVSNTSAMHEQPLRDSACGSVLLRCNKFGDRDDISHRGEICGMIHMGNHCSKYTRSAERHLVYAESFDELIKDGWSVVPHVAKLQNGSGRDLS